MNVAEIAHGGKKMAVLTVPRASGSAAVNQQVEVTIAPTAPRPRRGTSTAPSGSTYFGRRRYVFISTIER